MNELLHGNCLNFKSIDRVKTHDDKIPIMSDVNPQDKKKNYGFI